MADETEAAQPLSVHDCEMLGFGAETTLGGEGVDEYPPAEQINAVVADPAWLPYRIRDAGRTLELIHLSRDQLEQVYFIDERSQPRRWQMLVGESARVKMPVAAIADIARTADSDPCHFIFHSAFCCSTLMSRALDIEGVACVLKEPRPFHELVVKKSGPSWSDDQKMALGVVLDLMQRPRLPGEKTIIKLANLANPIIDQIIERRPNSRALLMYCSLPGFLMAIGRRRRWSWVRNLAAFYRNHLEFETKQTRDLVLLTDLKMAAFLWLQYQAQFARIVRELPTGRVATLMAESFVAQPVQALAAAAAHFELALDQKQVEAITKGPLFQKHAKTDESFDASDQTRQESLVRFAYGEEIEQALQWGMAVAAEASIPLDLPAPLIS